MAQYQVTLVDVNDVWFTIPVNAQDSDEAWNIAKQKCVGCVVRSITFESPKVNTQYHYEDDVILDEDYDQEDDGMSDVEADADTLRNIGWGTDEDYGYYGEESYEY